MPGPQKGTPLNRKQTAAEKSAGIANLAKGRATREAKRADARASGQPKRSVRWGMLLDGTLSVHDLDDEELAAMNVKGADGSVGGRRRAIPSHIAMEFHREIIRRAEYEMRGALGKAAALLGKVMDDPEASNNDKIKAATILMDRVMGKTPETVVLKSEDKFADLMGDSVYEDRSLDDLSADGI